MKEMRNFHGFLPGGYLRQEFYRQNNPLINKIIEEIDKLIENDFDTEKYTQLVKENHEATEKISELFEEAREKGKEILKPHLDKMESSAKARNEMIYPLFEKLVSKGYDESQLKQ